MRSHHATRAPVDQPGASRGSRGVRWEPLLLGALVCVLVLSGCGARIDTIFRLENGPQGSREITLTLSRSDLDSYVSGGVASIDASVRQHLPAAMSYSGITEGDEIVATFTIDFVDAADYSAKVGSILEASGSTISPEITLTTEDSLFVQGTVVEESFTSGDLMGWLSAGLVEDGVVDADQQENILENGSTSVDVEGETTDMYSSQISFEDVRDSGISAISMTTWVQSDDTFERSINYLMPADTYATNPGGFDAYFQSVVPEGGSLTRQADEDGTIGWLLELEAAGAEQIVAQTNSALSSDASALEVSTEHLTGITMQSEIVDWAECARICSPHAPEIVSDIVLPAEWSLIAGQPDASIVADQDGAVIHRTVSDSTLVLEHGVDLESVDIATTIGHGFSIEQTITVRTRADAVAAAADEVQEALTPPTEVGEIQVASDEAGTTYTITVSADDVESFNEQMADFLPGSGIDVVTTSSSLFREESQVQIALSLVDLFGASAIADGLTLSIEAPFAQQVSGASSWYGTTAEEDGRSVTLRPTHVADDVIVMQVGGWTMVGLGVLAGGAATLVLALVAAVILRDRIRSAVRRATEVRQARAAARPTVLVTTPEGDSASPVVSPRGAVPSPTAGRDTFHESELV